MGRKIKTFFDKYPVLDGLVRALDIGGIMPPSSDVRDIYAQTEQEALRQDWEAVCGDFRTAFQHFASNHPLDHPPHD